jgi:leucyl/phenylalanyl-tRNA--protein transferase
VIKKGLFSTTLDRAFDRVIQSCALVHFERGEGTWIVPEMVAAYENLHRQGYAHSAEVWLDGQLVAGLYFVALGHAVFGESMFTRIPDGSKLALAALVGFCLENDIEWIDCQQNTRHLAAMGGHEIERKAFITWLAKATEKAAPSWQFNSVYWDRVLALPKT